MNPVLSVVVITYEHERFLDQAIKSILMQKTTFEYEVVIGVDASKDRTLEIAQAYAASYPKMVRVIAHRERVGLFRNFAESYGAVRGRYIALLEGDDYWTSENKLDLQVRLLESQPGTVLCGHATARVDVSGNKFGKIPDRAYPQVSDPNQFLMNYCDFHTSSLVFPDPFGHVVPPQLLDSKIRAFDLPLKFLLASRGRIAYLDAEMSAFRAVSGSASSSFEREREAWIRAMIRSLLNIKGLVSKDKKQLLNQLVGQLYWNLSNEPSLHMGDRAKKVISSLYWSPKSTISKIKELAINRAKTALRH